MNGRDAGAAPGRSSAGADGAASGGPDPPLEIESIAAGGDGVAREPSGRVVFVPRTAPGDRVRVRVEEERSRWARARLDALLEPGPDRAPAPCPYYPECGGCQLQHLDGAGRRAALGQVVRDALERIGGLTDVSVPEPENPGPEFGYRNRITLTLRRTDGGVRAGYHDHADPDRILDVEDCPLAETPVRRAWAVLREAWGKDAARLPAGPQLRITVRASADGDVAVVIFGGDPERPGDPEGLQRRLGTTVRLAGLHWRDASGRRRRLGGEDTLQDRWQGVDVPLRPEAFLQVNRRVAAAIDRHLEEGLGPREGLEMVDLYAGVGVRAIAWARRGARVTAVERDGDAVRSGREAARGADAPVRFLRGRVEERLEATLPADRLVVNPPRSGLSRPVCRMLRDGGAPLLAYVSCDPATLARDLRRLRPAWRVRAVRPFDAFPQTAHVETVAWLEPS